MSQNKPKHHYVPQFILRNFITKPYKKDQVWCFDKQTEKDFKNNVDSVAAEFDFYDYDTEKGKVTVEPTLADLETEWSVTVEKIVANGKLEGLTIEDIKNLCLYTSFAMLRTRNKLNDYIDTTKTFQKKIKKLFKGQDVMFEEDIKKEPTEEDAKEYMLHSLLQSSKKMAILLSEKDLVLYKTDNNKPFMIADNPISMHNRNSKDQLWGHVGLAVKGVEIMCPLSKNYTLSFLCPSILEETKIMLYKLAMQLKLGFPDLPHAPKMRLFYNSLNTGLPYECDSEQVNYINFNQIQNSERWIYCCNNDFSFIKKTLVEYPDLKSGPRMKIH